MAMRFQPKKLAALRKKRKLSYGGVADPCGVSRQSVFRWETGDRIPSMASLDKLAKGMGVPFLFFLGS